MSVAENVANVGASIIKREGLLGLVLLALCAMLGWLAWSTEKQNSRLSDVVVSSYEMQRRSAIKSVRETDAVKKNTEILVQLAETNKLTARNLQHLVSVVSMRIENDEVIGRKTFEALQDLVAQTKRTADTSDEAIVEIKSLAAIRQNEIKEKAGIPIEGAP